MDVFPQCHCWLLSHYRNFHLLTGDNSLVLLYHQALFIFQIISRNGCIYGLIQMVLICCHRVIKPWLGHSFLQQPVTAAVVSLCSQSHASHAVSTIPSLSSPVSCAHPFDHWSLGKVFNKLLPCLSHTRLSALLLSGSNMTSGLGIKIMKLTALQGTVQWSAFLIEQKILYS